MSATTTQLIICNLALRSIGGAKITALSDAVESARILSDIYDTILDEVLSAHPWNFAIKRDTLTDDEVTPEFDWDYTYSLPSDCLRVIKMEGEGIKFEIAAGKLLTDESEAKIKYIARITDPTKFSASFISAFVLRLGSELAYPLSSNQELFKQKYEEYREKLQMAKSIDGQEGTLETEDETSWIDERS